MLPSHYGLLGCGYGGSSRNRCAGRLGSRRLLRRGARYSSRLRSVLVARSARGQETYCKDDDQGYEESVCSFHGDLACLPYCPCRRPRWSVAQERAPFYNQTSGHATGVDWRPKPLRGPDSSRSGCSVLMRNPGIALSRCHSEERSDEESKVLAHTPGRPEMDSPRWQALYQVTVMPPYMCGQGVGSRLRGNDGFTARSKRNGIRFLTPLTLRSE